jgi:DNA-binding transcriptional LysR family regulator
VDFDLIDIRLFVDVADMNSLTRGAERSNMTPPSASLRIKNIEDRMHTKLLHRSNRGVTLTAAGKAFLHHGRLMLLHAQQLQDELREYAKGIRGHVRLLANTSAVSEFLPAVLGSFLGAHPDVSVDLVEQHSPAIVRAVLEGTAEIGIVAGTIATNELVTYPYREDRLVLMTPRGHVLARKRHVAFSDTLEFNHVGLGEGSALFRFLTQKAQALNATLKTRIRVGNFESLCRMIEANVGVGVIPAYVARRYSRHMELRVVPLNDEWARRDLQICIRSAETLPMFAKWLLDALLADANAAAATVADAGEAHKRSARRARVSPDS